METNLKAFTNPANNHTVATEPNHLINGLEFKSLVDFCSSLLWTLAREKKCIHYGSLFKRLKKRAPFHLKTEDFNRVLQEVNERSWKGSKILLTVLVHCSNRMAGGGLFAQARKLGAIQSYPEDIETRQRLACNLESHVFSVAQHIQPQNQ